MIAKLKVECGFNTVSKLQRMFQDMEISKETMKDFKKTFKDGVVKDVTINADILTQGIWPEQNIIPVKLP